MNLQDLRKFNIDPKDIEFYVNKVKNQKFIVVITGEFSSGKTCFLNAFMNKKGFLPEDNMECTPVLIELYKNDSSNMQIKYIDGRELLLPISEENINRYTKHVEGYDEKILSVEIPVDSPYIPEGVHIIDSPGTNTIIKQHTEINNYIIQKADIVLYTLNKVISETDLISIQNILTYTKDIIFIVTHMDDRDRTPDEIQRLLAAVKTDLEEKLNIECPEVLPVGSIKAYENQEQIDVIRTILVEYLKNYSQKDMKNKVVNQMTLLFEEHILKLKQKNNLYNISFEKDQVQIFEKLEEINNKLLELDSKQQSKKFRIDEVELEEIKEIEEEIKKSFSLKAKEITEEILEYKEISKELLESKFKKSENELGKRLKSIVEEHINSFLSKVYERLNFNLNEIMEGLEIKILHEIKEPSIEKLDNDTNSLEIQELEKMIEDSERNLMEVQEQISCSEEEKERIKENIEAIKSNMHQYIYELRELLESQPSYHEHIVAGGGDVGAKAGRVLGEVADIALIFYKPEAGVKMVADRTKDTAKLASYIAKSTNAIKTSALNVKKTKNVLYKVNSINKNISKEDAKQVFDEIVKIKKTGEEIIKKEKESSEHSPATLESLGKMLDFMSVGYWGEKLGKYLGEMIEPSKTLIEINHELEAQRRSKEIEMKNLVIKKESLESAYEDADNIKKKISIKREIESNIERYKQLKKELEEKEYCDKIMDVQSQTKNYYQTEIEKLFQLETIKAIETVSLVFGNAVKKTKEQIELEVENLIFHLQETMDTLSLEKNEREEVVANHNKILEELKEYPNWIEEWVF